MKYSTKSHIRHFGFSGQLIFGLTLFTAGMAAAQDWATIDWNGTTDLKKAVVKIENSRIGFKWAHFFGGGGDWTRMVQLDYKDAPYEIVTTVGGQKGKVVFGSANQRQLKDVKVINETAESKTARLIWTTDAIEDVTIYKKAAIAKLRYSGGTRHVFKMVTGIYPTKIDGFSGSLPEYPDNICGARNSDGSRAPYSRCGDKAINHNGWLIYGAVTQASDTRHYGLFHVVDASKIGKIRYLTSGLEYLRITDPLTEYLVFTADDDFAKGIAIGKQVANWANDGEMGPIPTTGVPEPSSCCLALLGLGMLRTIVRKPRSDRN